MSDAEQSQPCKVPKEAVATVSETFEEDEDTTDCSYEIDPSELHEKYQQYVKANGSKNSSVEIYEDEGDLEANNASSLFSKSTTDSEFQQLEVEEIFQQNKTISQRNDELWDKTEELQRQLDAAEDESEQQKKEISTLEKELKNCRDIILDRDNLESEMEQLQSNYEHACESQLVDETTIKRLKNDEEELMKTIKTQREQIESLNDDMLCMSTANKKLYEENTSLKDRYESLQMDVELKDQELEQKMQLYQEMRERAEGYKASIQNLHEEKESLMNQLREVQLEVSTYQTYHKMANDSTSVSLMPSCQPLHNLQSEIAEAEQTSMLKSFDNSIPNTPNLSSRKRKHSALNSDQFSTPVKLDELTPKLQDVFIDHCIQTEDQRKSPRTPEELAELKKQLIAMHDELENKESHIRKLNENLNVHVEKGQYLARQLGMNRTKTKELISRNEKLVNEFTHVIDEDHKLCASKFQTWFETSSNIDGHMSDNNKNITEFFADDDGALSPLVEALALENLTKRNETVSHDLQGAGDWEKYVAKAQFNLKCRNELLTSRLCVLNKYKSIMEEAVEKKIELIRDLMREVVYRDHLPSLCDELQPVMVTSQDIDNHLRTAHTLMLRYGSYMRPIGALRMEEQLGNTIQVLVKQLGNLKITSCKLKSKLTKLMENKEHKQSTDSEQSHIPNSVVAAEEDMIVEVTSNLMCSIFMPYYSDWMEKLPKNEILTSLLIKCVKCSCKVQEKFSKLSRTSLFMLILVLCSIFTITPLDYQVEPVY